MILHRMIVAPRKRKPPNSGQQVEVDSYYIVTLPYGFIQSTTIAKTFPPKKIGHVQFELKVSLEEHVLFHFGMNSGSNHIFLGLYLSTSQLDTHGNVSDHS